jgi:hypothetical protein
MTVHSVTSVEREREVHIDLFFGWSVGSARRHELGQRRESVEGTLSAVGTRHRRGVENVALLGRDLRVTVSTAQLPHHHSRVENTRDIYTRDVQLIKRKGDLNKTNHFERPHPYLMGP